MAEDYPSNPFASAEAATNAEADADADWLDQQVAQKQENEIAQKKQAEKKAEKEAGGRSATEAYHLAYQVGLAARGQKPG